jgi:hypothetical protein
MFADQEQLNKILSGDLAELNKLIEEISVKTTEATLRSIPVMLGKLLQVTSSTQELVKDVYDRYPEFKGYKEVVILTIQEVESQNAGLDFKAVVEKAIPLIQQKIAEYDKIVKATSGSPSVQDIEKRLNGAI